MQHERAIYIVRSFICDRNQKHKA